MVCVRVVGLPSPSKPLMIREVGDSKISETAAPELVLAVNVVIL